MAESRFDAAPGEAKRPSDEALPLENELMSSAGNAGSAGVPEMLPDNLLAGGAESASSLSSSPADEAYVGSPDAGGEDAVPESAWQRVSKWTPLQNVLGLLALLISFGAYYLSRELEDTDSLSSTFDFARETASRVGIYIVGGLAIAIVLTLIWGWANWRARSFALTDRGIHIRSGILFKRHNQLRWDRVQAVDIKRSIIARLVGQGTVEVSPGGMQLSAVSIGLLPVETCEKLRAYILDVAARVRAGEKPAIENWQERETTAEDQQEIYRLGTGRLAGSSVLSGRFFIGLLGLVFMLALTFWDETPRFWALALLWLGALYGAFSALDKSWGARVRVAPDGLESSRGLTSTTTQTILPDRVHAVRIFQPALWKPFGWWKLEVTTADASLDSLADAKVAVVPAGSLDEVLLCLWVIMPDLGVADRDAFLREALTGEFAMAGFVAAPRGARWVDPIGWKRAGVAITPIVAVLRHGRWWRKQVTLVFHHHYQSLVSAQGPIQRQLGLATIKFAMVSNGSFAVEQQNLALEDVRDLVAAENAAGKEARARQ